MCVFLQKNKKKRKKNTLICDTFLSETEYFYFYFYFRFVGNQTVLVTIDFHCMKKN